MNKIIRLFTMLGLFFLFFFNFCNVDSVGSMIHKTNSYDLNEISTLNYTELDLNEKEYVTITNGSIAYFVYTPDDDGYFVIETFGSYDTKIMVENTAEGTIIDDDAGEGLNAKIDFKGLESQQVYISVKLYSVSASGTFVLQLRKQRFSMFGYVDDDGNSTIPDLTTPYNLFCSSYDCMRYQNGTADQALASDNSGFSAINSEIMFFSGHGLENEDETEFGFGVAFKSGYITTSTSLNMNKNKVSLLAACYSANSNNSSSLSIAEYLVNCGSKSSIGFTDSISFSSSKTFSDRFFTKLASGYSVADSAKYGSKGLVWPWDNAKNYVIFGDEDIKVTDTTTSSSTFCISNIDFSLLNEIDGYECYYSDNTYKRYYQKIDNYLTNSFIDIEYNNNTIVDINDYRKEISSILKINNNYLNNNLDDMITVDCYTYLLEKEISRNIVYYSINGIMTPIEIIIGNYRKGDIIIEESKCVNLNTGKLIDYSMINGI